MSNVNQAVIEKIKETIVDFFNKKMMFTAYDVTKQTREREKINLRHRDLNGQIHDLELVQDALDYGYDLPDGQTVKYQKTQKDVGNGVWAFVYHPSFLDPNNYIHGQSFGIVVQTNSSSSQTPAINSISISASNTDSGGQDDDGTFTADYRNRLMVPTKFMKEAGFLPGDKAYIVVCPVNNVVSIFKDESEAQNHSAIFTVQKVERNGDIRISSRTLKAAELKENQYLIETPDLQGKKIVQIKSTSSN